MQIINCTALISQNATDEYFIMYQLKPFKQNIYPENNQLEGMNNLNDDEFSITSRICKVCIAIK